MISPGSMAGFRTPTPCSTGAKHLAKRSAEMLGVLKFFRLIRPSYVPCATGKLIHDRQFRLGTDGQRLSVYRFRPMVRNSDAGHVPVSMKHGTGVQGEIMLAVIDVERDASLGDVAFLVTGSATAALRIAGA